MTRRSTMMVGSCELRLNKQAIKIQLFSYGEGVLENVFMYGVLKTAELVGLYSTVR